VPRSFDVFCHVIDNFGDAAVCWRLARALARLPSHPAVRLWIDELTALRALEPALLQRSRQSYSGVEVIQLGDAGDFDTPAEVAVDAFGGGLPEAYARAMAQRTEHGSRALWIVLEYLSAEPWVATHHGLPSPHPRLALKRYFFFPGVGAGGLLREAGLDERRDAFLRDPEQQAALWRMTGFAAPAQGKLVTLFGYEGAPAKELLQAWADGTQPVLAAVPASRLTPSVAAFMEARGPAAALAGQSMRRGALEVRFLPFLPQDRYDELLWSADWNFVRGEDSFVRAQWAERPLVWQLYPQAGGAHLVKLEAFIAAYCRGEHAEIREPLARLLLAWNGAVRPSELATAWRALAGREEQLRRQAREWARRAAASGDLAMNLDRFCADRL
jgi:uncharacterized repeat protein (TIGR03837 family)